MGMKVLFMPKQMPKTKRERKEPNHTQKQDKKVSIFLIHYQFRPQQLLWCFQVN